MKFLLKSILASSIMFVAILENASVKDTPEWQKEMEGVPEKPKTGRTLVFAQAQLKYGLNSINGTYIARWLDRPLFINPEIPVDPKWNGSLWSKDYEKIQEILKRYNMDGFSFYVQSSGRASIYKKTQESPVKDFRIISILYSTSSRNDIELMGKALACDKSLLIDGKLPVLVNNDSNPEYWNTLMKKLREKYGDRFLFIGGPGKMAGKSVIEWCNIYRKNEISLKNLMNIKDDLRTQLRKMDGVCIGHSVIMNDGKRNFYTSFYRDFLIKLTQSVLGEPEFKDKYFILTALVGHENPSAIGYIMSHDGTKTLRNSFEAAMSANPDIIIIPEWDEENENTSLRPTVYNGLSSMRIMRYYMAKIKNQPLTPMPGDRTDIPDLTISFRKLLCIGEKIKIELLNIPDSEKNEPYAAKLILKDINGKVLKEFPAMAFNSNEMKDHTVEIPSEDLAQEQVLIPGVEIDYKGKKTYFENGLHYIELRPTWNWDYKWVKQPLRDLIISEKSSFAQAESSDKLLKNFKGEFVSPEELNYVEVLDNDDIVYICENDMPRENNNEKVLKFTFQSNKEVPSGNLINGSISVENAKCEWNKNLRTVVNMSINGKTIQFKNCRLSGWTKDFYLSIPAGEIGNAVLDIHIDGIYTGKILVCKIIDEQTFVLAGEKGVCAVNRFIRQVDYPKHLKKKTASFDINLIPDLKSSIIHMEAITETGKTYRSKPILIRKEKSDAPMKEIIVYSDSRKKPVALKIAADRVPFLKYEFTPEHGAALICDEGRSLWGILGGFAPQVTMRNGGESGYGYPFPRQGAYPANVIRSFPEWVKEDNGEYSLRFDGIGTYVVLPQGAMPRRTAFEISMMIMPEDAEKKQLIIGNRSNYPGFIGSVFLEKGFLRAENILVENYVNTEKEMDMDTGKSLFSDALKIPSGKWSSIKIIYDQEYLQFEVNGQKSEKFKCRGPGLYDTVTVIGGYANDWFKGKIKDFQILHALQQQ